MSQDKAQENADLKFMAAKKRSVIFFFFFLFSLTAIFAYYQLSKPGLKSKTVAVKKKSVVSLQKKALILYKQQKFKQAIKSLNLYLRQNPNDVDARKMLAESYEQLNLFSPALAQYRLIIKKRPTTETLYQTAILFKLQKKYQAAINLLEKALQKEPNKFLVKVELAKTFTEVSKLEAAEKQWQEVIASLAHNDPYKPIAYAELGDVLKQSGQLAKAKDAYEAGLKLEPTNEYLKQQVAGLTN